MYKKTYFSIVLTFCLSATLALANTPTPPAASAASADGIASVILQGFAKWNASRVEKIILTSGLRSAAENKYMVRMFPTATSMINTYQHTGAKALLPMIQDSVQYDIDRFTYVFEKCFPKKLKSISSTEELKDLSVTIKSFFVIPEDSTKAQGSGFIVKSAKAYPKDFLLEFSNKICDATQQKNLVAGADEVARKTLKAEPSVSLTEEDYEELARLYAEHADIDELDAVVSLIAAYRQLHSVFANPNSYALKMHAIVVALDRVGTYSKTYYPSFSKFQNLGFFFVAMVQAGENKDADLVAQLLDTYTDTQAAYQDKRKPGGVYSSYFAAIYPDIEADVTPTEDLFENMTTSTPITTRYFTWRTGFDLYVASYYGISGVKLEDIDTGDDEHTYRFFGPVGFELKAFTCIDCLFGLTGVPGTWGINYSPIDIGGYITNELMNDTYSPSFEDAVAPSAFFSYSLKDYPVAFLFGKQYNIRIDKDKRDDSVFFSVAFDLPVATIF